MRIPVLFAGDFTPDAILWEGGQDFCRLDNGQRGELHALVRSFCADYVMRGVLDGDDAIEEAVRWTDAWWAGDNRVTQHAHRLMERMEGGFR